MCPGVGALTWIAEWSRQSGNEEESAILKYEIAARVTAKLPKTANHP